METEYKDYGDGKFRSEDEKSLFLIYLKGRRKRGLCGEYQRYEFI